MAKDKNFGNTRMVTTTANIGEFGIPPHILGENKKKIIDAAKATKGVDCSTGDMGRLLIYLDALDAAQLSQCTQEIVAARECIRSVMNQRDGWKTLLSRADAHWILNAMLLNLA